MSSPGAALDGRVYAIAGVGGGLGPVVAGRLAAAGATVAGTDRDQALIDEVGAGLGLPAERWDGRTADLLDEESARGWRAALIDRFGRVDGFCTWSAAGAAAGRCTRRRSRTGTSSTTC